MRPARAIGATVYLVTAQLRVLRTVIVVLPIYHGMHNGHIALRVVDTRLACCVWLVDRNIASRSKPQGIGTVGRYDLAVVGCTCIYDIPGNDHVIACGDGELSLKSSLHESISPMTVVMLYWRRLAERQYEASPATGAVRE